MSAVPQLKGIKMVSIYTPDLDKTVAFYRDVLGLDPRPMGEFGAYCEFGGDDGSSFGCYFQGRRPELPPAEERTARTTFTFEVASAAAMFAHLEAHDVRTIQDAPEDMGQGMFWFEAIDPHGLSIEFLGRA